MCHITSVVLKYLTNNSNTDILLWRISAKTEINVARSLVSMEIHFYSSMIWQNKGKWVTVSLSWCVRMMHRKTRSRHALMWQCKTPLHIRVGAATAPDTKLHMRRPSQRLFGKEPKPDWVCSCAVARGWEEVPFPNAVNQFPLGSPASQRSDSLEHVSRAAWT